MHGVFDLCFYIWLTLSMYWPIAIKGLVVCDSNILYKVGVLNYAITSNQTIKQAWILDHDFMFCLPDNNVDCVHNSMRQYTNLILTSQSYIGLTMYIAIHLTLHIRQNSLLLHFHFNVGILYFNIYFMISIMIMNEKLIISVR